MNVDASLTFAGALLCLSCTATIGRAQVWSDAPLRAATPMPRDGLPAERQAFFARLQQNATGLRPDQLQTARERVFAYVSLAARAHGGAFVIGDSALTTAFEAAARLGVAGTAEVYRVLAPAAPPVRSSQVPPGVTLVFQGSQYSLGADDASWGVCLPYYFMVGALGRQVPANGVQTEFAMISTLFAHDSGEAGASQATILIAAAAPADSARHVALWLRQLGVAPQPGAALDSSGDWYASAASEPMHRLAVVKRLPNRVVIVAYIGLGGTYQVNQAHFVDVLRTLAGRRCAA